MNRDVLLMYGDRIPLPIILGHDRLRSLCKTGLELRRAAARALNDAMAEAGLTRVELSELAQADYQALSKICNGRHSMDTGILKQVLWHLDRDWRKARVRFAEAIDYAREPTAGARSSSSRDEAA